MNVGWVDFSVNVKPAEVEYCIIAMEKNILFRCQEWFYTSVCVCVCIYILFSKGSGKKLCIHRHTYAHTHKGYANDKVG